MNQQSEISMGAPIFSAIRDRICTLEMPHGTRLREVELAAEFGVSRTPVRQALHQLATLGLVETRNGVGTIVTAGDPESLSEIYALRVQLAGLIGVLATGPCPAGAAEKMQALAEAVAAQQSGCSARDFWRLNEQRHRIVNEIVENRELRSLHDLYYYKVAPFWFALFRENPAREFALLVREVQETAFWLAQGDMQAVANMQQNHISMAAQRLGQV